MVAVAESALSVLSTRLETYGSPLHKRKGRHIDDCMKESAQVSDRNSTSDVRKDASHAQVSAAPAHDEPPLPRARTHVEKNPPVFLKDRGD